MSNQISTPVLGTKENPILIANQKIEELKDGKRYHFFSSSCGKEVIKGFNKSIYKTIEDFLLCKRCSCRKTRNFIHADKDNPYYVNSIAELRNIKIAKGQYYSMKCECEVLFHRQFNKNFSDEKLSHCQNCLTHITLKERYGDENYGMIGSKSFKENMIKKYGIENCATLESTREKYKQTCLDKYDVDNTFNIKEVREKTNLASHTEEIKKIISEKNKLNAKERMEKSRRTCLEKYGVEYSFQSENNKEKSKKTCLEHFGQEFPSYMGRKRIYYDNIWFDSTYEVYFYIFLKWIKVDFKYQPCSFEYKDKNGKTHRYYPDFEVNGKFYEIKGSHLLKDGKLYNIFTKEILEEKTQCLIDNNVKIVKESFILQIQKRTERKYGKIF